MIVVSMVWKENLGNDLDQYIDIKRFLTLSQINVLRP